ncbi:MAG: UDP-N-acetylmuramate--L-alanine ligase [Candidatus Omnitrophica bacterium]|nr:UDP-N-acetylmuramate--L-alanine ligase [Candidatus Omnitrophota bacterium]
MNKHYHFIGIGGIGMSGIAGLLLSRGQKVSGSDIKESPSTRSLAQLGARIFIGHAASNIQGADVIVYSSAIKEDNPEMRAARAAGIPVHKRAQALAGLMQDKKVICVAGSHGKTTTTSLVSHILIEAGLSPTLAIGGNFKNINTNAALGKGDHFVAEADESDGSFLYYSPFYSIITNIDREHLDHYKTFEAVVAAYKEFMGRTDTRGCLIACGDDANLARLCAGFSGRRLMFGLGKCNDVYAQDIELNGLRSSFECVFKGEKIGRFELSLAGTHNVSNALSAVALSEELKIDRQITKKALATYKGAGRRMDLKWQSDNFTVIDDYAHHPTEIKATISAVRSLPCKRLVVVFQPHRYTRTALLLEDFAGSFNSADKIILTDIYAASEEPLPGVDSAGVAAAIKKLSGDKDVTVVARKELFAYVRDSMAPGDIILTLGAGDITRISDELACWLAGKI